MPKMRVLIAARAERRSALALALGVHRARPEVEVGTADTRQRLFQLLKSGSWHAVVISRTFDGADAGDILTAASDLLGRTSTLVLEDEADVQAAASTLLNSGLSERRRPDPRGSELPACESLHEFLALDGRQPRTGLLSCILIRSNVAAEQELSSSIAAGAACRWRDEGILVVRRAASPGEALVWAETLHARIARPAMGVTWFRATDLQESMVNQAEHALRLAEERRCGVSTWTSVVALRHAERIAGSIDEPEARREHLLKDLPLGPEQRRQLTIHSQQVADAAADLARLLRLEPEACEQVRLAGLLHDLGKIAIPDDLLAKPGPLSPEERRVLDRHSAEGAWLCEALGIEREVARIVRHHHTRFDALEIAPDAARIVAVADAMVTMTSVRPYSAARTFEYALAELRRCRGTVFDPRVVVAAHILGASDMQAAA